MISPRISRLNRETRSAWLRLRTLILLRWLAVIGQLVAISIAIQVYHITLPLGLCLLVIGASVLANLVASFTFPENKRLSEVEAMLTLLFDISQLALLLFLTGGLNNPFALLILAPVTISATVLQQRTTVLLALSAITFITLISVWSLPLTTAVGETLRLSPIFAFGFWLAIVTGILFLGLYSWRVSSEIHSMADALLATQMALSREQKLTDIGGVVAAAAHELGTPLATIKLVSAELMEDLVDFPDLRDDAALIRDQADRCRDILRSMGRTGKDDLHLHQAPLAAVIREAAEPHASRGKTIHFHLDHPEASGADSRPPSIRRAPEIIHGIRNLVQNAVDFAQSTVWVEADWSATRITLRICDDGPGFPPQLIGRIGDPFVRGRRQEPEPSRRAEYEGMGLGLFIAKTLLERTGATLSFSNGEGGPGYPGALPTNRGAIVVVTWPRHLIVQVPKEGLGQNRPIAI